MKIPLFFRIIFNRTFFEKMLVFIVFAILAYDLSSFFILFFTTFLFVYLFSELAGFLHKHIHRVIDGLHGYVHKRLLKKIFSFRMIVCGMYIFFLGLVFFATSTLVPKLVQELTQIPQSIPFFGDQLDKISSSLGEIINFNQDVQGSLSKILTDSNVDFLLKFINNIRNAGALLLQFLFSIVLSFLLIIDKESIMRYFDMIKHGNFSFIHREFQNISHKLELGFGMIFRTQAIIAVINSILTLFGLFIIGLLYNNGAGFPYIMTLVIIVFVCGFVPIVGTFISSIPILTIGYGFGGLHAILAILTMIAIVHAIESYYLNPRIVSSYMHVPMSFTFIVLLLAEHYFGFIGLLVGMPLFFILVDIFKDIDQYIDKIKRTHRELKSVSAETKDLLENGIRLSRSGKRGPQ